MKLPYVFRHIVFVGQIVAFKAHSSISKDDEKTGSIKIPDNLMRFEYVTSNANPNLYSNVKVN